MRARFHSRRWITAALVLSLERGAGRRGAWEAWEVLSGSRKEEDEEGQHHSRVEAWEEVLSCLEAQVDLRERRKTVIM